MTKGNLRKYPKKKVKVFIFFLVVASVFWILTKFSREFTASVVAKVNYRNLPKTVALSENTVNEISFDLTANGFEIIFYKLKKPSLEVDVSKYYDTTKNGFVISRNELVRNLSGQFNKYMDIRNLSVEGLEVNLDPIVLKKIAVRPQLDIAFKHGFKPIDSILVQPDSVTISGPEGVLSQIFSVKTELVSLDNVEKTISQTARIVSPSSEVENITPNEVKLQWSVAEFSQGKLTLPVEVINLPPGIELKLVPERMTVSFDIAVSDFAAVSPENFRVVCDYSKRNSSENFMLPQLKKKPQGAVNVVFEPKKIDFFIFK